MLKISRQIPQYWHLMYRVKEVLDDFQQSLTLLRVSLPINLRAPTATNILPRISRGCTHRQACTIDNLSNCRCLDTNLFTGQAQAQFVQFIKQYCKHYCYCLQMPFINFQLLVPDSVRRSVPSPFFSSNCIEL